MRIEVDRAQEDFDLGVPLSKNGTENLRKVVAIKNTIATSTASVERAFSGMNRICTRM